MRIAPVALACAWGVGCAARVPASAPSLSPAGSPKVDGPEETAPIDQIEDSLVSILCVAYAPDGSLLALGGQGGLLVLDTATGQPVRALKSTATEVFAVAFSPDGKVLAVGGRRAGDGEGGLLELLNADGGEKLELPATAATESMLAIAFADGGETLVTAGSGLGFPAAHGIVEIWSVPRRERQALIIAPAERITTIAMSADGATIVGGGYRGARGVLKLWRAPDWKVAHELDTAVPDVLSVAWSRDGSTIVAAGRKSLKTAAPVELWDAGTGRRRRELLTKNVFVNSLSFSPDGATLAVGGENGDLDGAVELWDFKAGTLRNTIAVNSHAYTTAVFSPDGRTLAAAGARGYLARSIGVLDLRDVGTPARRRTTILAPRPSPGPPATMLVRNGVLRSVEADTLSMVGADGVERQFFLAPTNCLSVGGKRAQTLQDFAQVIGEKISVSTPATLVRDKAGRVVTVSVLYPSIGGGIWNARNWALVMALRCLILPGEMTSGR